jgi:hypothetical protein
MIHLSKEIESVGQSTEDLARRASFKRSPFDDAQHRRVGDDSQLSSH